MIYIKYLLYLLALLSIIYIGYTSYEDKIAYSLRIAEYKKELNTPSKIDDLFIRLSDNKKKIEWLTQQIIQKKIKRQIIVDTNICLKLKIEWLMEGEAVECWTWTTQ